MEFLWEVMMMLYGKKSKAIKYKWEKINNNMYLSLSNYEYLESICKENCSKRSFKKKYIQHIMVLISMIKGSTDNIYGHIHK